MWKNTSYETEADPGFSLGAHPPFRGLPTYDFAKFSKINIK